MEVLKAKEYLSVNEACKLIGVSRMTLHRQIRSRRLKATAIGRRVIIRREDIDSMLL
jgi:excisionase family DNA binding protein